MLHCLSADSCTHNVVRQVIHPMHQVPPLPGPDRHHLSLPGMAPCGPKGPRFLGPNVYSQAPDGGWGWVVAVAFFVVEVFTYGTIKSFGIFLQDLMTEFEEPNSRVLWIVSICVFVMTFNGESLTVKRTALKSNLTWRTVIAFRFPPGPQGLFPRFWPTASASSSLSWLGDPWFPSEPSPPASPHPSIKCTSPMGWLQVTRRRYCLFLSCSSRLLCRHRVFKGARLLTLQG